MFRSFSRYVRAGTVQKARVLEQAGGAAVVLEADSSGQELFRIACGISFFGYFVLPSSGFRYSGIFAGWKNSVTACSNLATVFSMVS